jgi:hypothetical protein
LTGIDQFIGKDVLSGDISNKEFQLRNNKIKKSSLFIDYDDVVISDSNSSITGNLDVISINRQQV